MGIEFHAVQFLRYAAKQGQFGRVATIGRQSLDIGEERLRDVLRLPAEYKHEHYAETLLKDYFGATCVESFDNSDYEGADHVEDMNKPLGKSYRPYDTVIDFGCLEHIYNAPQAFRNLSELCCEGGQILHILPANNLCGHGFWQFSPELFFSLYSKENGYGETQVFLADISQERIWHQVSKPENGQRIELDSWARLFLLCRTIKGATFSHERVQQSDYVVTWAKSTTAPTTKEALEAPLISTGKRPVRRDPITRLVDQLRHVRASMRGDLSPRVQPRGLTKRLISSL